MRLLVFVALLSVMGAAQEKPAIRGSVSSNGLNDFAKVVLPMALQKLKEIKIPDVSDSDDVPLLGKIDYKMSDIKIIQVDCNDVKVAFSPIRCNADGLDLCMSLNWAYRQQDWPHVHGDGTADISLSDSSVSLQAHIIKPQQYLQVAVDSTDVELRNLEVKVHGSDLSWLINLIIKEFKRTFVKYVEKAIDTEVKQTLEQMVDELLSTLPTHVPVFQNTVLNLDILTIPEQKEQLLYVPFKGQFEDATTPMPFPGAHHDLPYLSMERMVAVQVSDWVANSLLWLETQRGLFDITVEQKDLPSWIPLKLNTKTFKFFFPKLFLKYPDAPLRFKMGASRATVHIKPEVKHCSFDAGLEVGFEVEWMAQWVPVFMLGVDVTGSFAAGIRLSNFTWSMEELNTKASVVWSKIEGLSVKVFDTVLNALASSVGVSMMNNELPRDFPLPMVEDIVPVNPKLTLYDGFAFLESDIKYSPSNSTLLALHTLTRL